MIRTNPRYEEKPIENKTKMREEIAEHTIAFKKQGGKISGLKITDAKDRNLEFNWTLIGQREYRRVSMQ